MHVPFLVIPIDSVNEENLEEVFPDVPSPIVTVRTRETLRPLVNDPKDTDRLLEMAYSRKRKLEASDHHSDGEEVVVKKVRTEDPRPPDITYAKYDTISPQYCEKLTNIWYHV